MPLRKQIIKNESDVPSEGQQVDGNVPEDDEDGDDKDELSSLLSPSTTRQKRRRERENRSKPKEMTEEEMMDLALRLSKQEASNTALQLQQEEEAMMKAIQESMVSQAQPGPASQSQSLLAKVGAPFWLCPRRKLSYSNGKRTPAASLVVSADVQGPETDPDRGVKEAGYKKKNWSKKRKRGEGSPLLQMPDLSQTQKILSQASPFGTELPLAAPDSPQCSNSTQIDNFQLGRSPIFPRIGFTAKVDVPRLSQDLLETCRTSGFVLCSQDSQASTQEPPPALPKSPTFPKSPGRSGYLVACPGSPVPSETDLGVDGETQLDPEYHKSPVFGWNTQRQRCPKPRDPPVGNCPPACENSGFLFSTQESLTPSLRSASRRPKSPVFLGCPGPPKDPARPERSAARRSPVFPETGCGLTERSGGSSTSPVFGPSGRRHKGGSADPRDQDDGFNAIDAIHAIGISPGSVDAAAPSEASGGLNSDGTELSSNMTLLWSDEDEDIPPEGSTSPVFPEERSIHGADGPAVSLSHGTAAPPATSGSNLRPQDAHSLGSWGDANKRTSLQPPSPATTEREPRPTGNGGAARGASATPAGSPTVHYYWGVPFCPQGLDPDSYTQVILAQMEVYEKSLKLAQRGLLRKAQWGEAVLPQPEKPPSPAASPQHDAPPRRGLRQRGKMPHETSDSPSAEEEEEDEEEDRNVGEEEKERERENKKEEKEEEEAQVDVDDCRVCPETQLSDEDHEPDPTMVADAAARLRRRRKHLRDPEVIPVEVISDGDAPAGAKPQEEDAEMEVDMEEERKREEEMEVEMEVDAPVDGGTEGDEVGGGQNLKTAHGKDPDVVEIKAKEDLDVVEMKDGGPRGSESPGPLSALSGPRSPEPDVLCPICQRCFPVAKVELHAAFCDGEAARDRRKPGANHVQTSSKPRHKRTRGAEKPAEGTEDASDAGGHREKCYICQRAVPLGDYSRHTELCIRRRRSSKSAAKVNLVSALEQTENRDSEAGTSRSKVQAGEVIDLLDDDDDVLVLGVSGSPLRSLDLRKPPRATKPSRGCR